MSFREKLRDTAKILGVDVGTEYVDTDDLLAEINKVLPSKLGGEKKYWHQIRIEVDPKNFVYGNNKTVSGTLVAYLDYYSDSNDRITTMTELYELLKTNNLSGIQVGKQGSFYEPHFIRTFPNTYNSDINMYVQHPVNSDGSKYWYTFLKENELNMYNIYDSVFENDGHTTTTLPMYTYVFDVYIEEIDTTVQSIPYTVPYYDLNSKKVLYLQNQYGWATYYGGYATGYTNPSNLYKIDSPEGDETKYLYYTDGVWMGTDKYQFKVAKVNLTTYSRDYFGANES